MYNSIDDEESLSQFSGNVTYEHEDKTELLRALESRMTHSNHKMSPVKVSFPLSDVAQEFSSRMRCR